MVVMPVMMMAVVVVVMAPMMVVIEIGGVIVAPMVVAMMPVAHRLDNANLTDIGTGHVLRQGSCLGRHGADGQHEATS